MKGRELSAAIRLMLEKEEVFVSLQVDSTLIPSFSGSSLCSSAPDDRCQMIVVFTIKARCFFFLKRDQRRGGDVAFKIFDEHLAALQVLCGLPCVVLFCVTLFEIEGRVFLGAFFSRGEKREERVALGRVRDRGDARFPTTRRQGETRETGRDTEWREEKGELEKDVTCHRTL